MNAHDLDRRRFLAGGASFVAGLALAGPANARVRVFGRSRAARRNVVLRQQSAGVEERERDQRSVSPYGAEAHEREYAGNRTVFSQRTQPAGCQPVGTLHYARPRRGVPEHGVLLRFDESVPAL